MSLDLAGCVLITYEVNKWQNQPKEFAVINGAGHNFNEDGAEEKLFKETLSFLK